MICTVESVGKIGTSYVQVRLRRPWQGRQIVPGQYIKVHVADKAATLAVVNYQESEYYFDVLVSPSDNVAINALRQTTKGQTFEVTGPSGPGYPEPLQDGYLLIAGGSGISSLVSVYEWSVFNDIKCRMIYFDRTGRFAYTELMSLLNDDGIRFRPWDTVACGRPQDPILGDEFDPATTRLCVCGPNSLTATIVDSLILHGINPSLACKNF
jgi:ferredoxin-NADP reductase